MSRKDATEGCHGRMPQKDVTEGCHERMLWKDAMEGCQGRWKFVQGKKKEKGVLCPRCNRAKRLRFIQFDLYSI